MIELKEETLKFINQWYDKNTVNKFTSNRANNTFKNKCITAIKYIFNNSQSLDNHIQIPAKIWKKELRSTFFSYKDVLIHLYNLNLIYFHSKRKKVSYGHPNWNDHRKY